METCLIYFQPKKEWALTPLAGIEHWSEDFTEIERIRTVEFYRDWNLRNVNLKAEQNIAKAGVGYEKNSSNFLQYSWNGFFGGQQYEAQKNQLLAKLKTKGFAADFNGSILHSGGQLSNTEFTRHKSLIKKQVYFFDIGYKDDREGKPNTRSSRRYTLYRCL